MSSFGNNRNADSTHIFSSKEKKVAIKKFEFNLKELKSWFEEAFDQTGVFSDIELCVSDLEKALSDSNLQTTLLRNYHAFEEIHKTTVFTVVGMILDQMFDIPEEEKERAKKEQRLPRCTMANKRNIIANSALNSVTQLGKTGIGLLFSVFAPCLYKLFRNENCWVYTTLPKQKALERQYCLSSNALTFVFKKIVFIHKNDSISLKDLHSAYLHDFNFDPNKSDNIFNRLTNSTRASDIAARLRNFETIFDHTFVNVDESDEGSGSDSVMKKAIGPMNNNPKISQNYLTASPFESKAIVERNDINLKITDAWIGNGYSGSHFSLGDSLNVLKGFKCRPLYVVPYANEFDVIDELNWNAYYKYRSYLKDKNITMRNGVPKTKKSHEAYKEEMLKAVCKIIHTALFDPNYEDNRKNNHQGFCIRINNKSSCTDFSQQLEKTYRSIYKDKLSFFELHSDSDNEDTTIKEFIPKKLGDDKNKKYVFFLVGMGRRGDQFPIPCSNFLKLGDCQNLTTEIQDFLGRASGYGKYSRVYLTKKAYRSYNNYCDNLGFSTIKPNGSRVGSSHSHKEISDIIIHKETILYLIKEGGRNKSKYFEVLKLLGEISNILHKEKSQGKAFTQGSYSNSLKIIPLFAKFERLAVSCPEICKPKNKSEIQFSAPLEFMKYLPCVQNGEIKSPKEWEFVKNNRNHIVNILEAKAFNGTLSPEDRCYVYHPTQDECKDENDIKIYTSCLQPLVRRRQSQYTSEGRNSTDKNWGNRRVEDSTGYDKAVNSQGGDDRYGWTNQIFYSDTECTGVKLMLQRKVVAVEGDGSLHLKKTHKDYKVS